MSIAPETAATSNQPRRSPSTTPKSGAQRRKERVERGLPKFTPTELAGRRERDRQRSSTRVHRNGVDLAALKQERGCADCGFSGHPAALHFDHLPGFDKRQNLSRMMRGYSRRAVLAEIAKCEVVCANCHAVRTWRRRYGTARGHGPTGLESSNA